MRNDDNGTTMPTTNAGSLREVLAEQLGIVQKMLTTSHDHAQILVEQQEVEIDRLHQEVKQLQNRLSFATVSGTCDSIEAPQQQLSDDAKSDCLQSSNSVDVKKLPPETNLLQDLTIAPNIVGNSTPMPPPRPEVELPPGPAPRIPDSKGLAWNSNSVVQESSQEEIGAVDQACEVSKPLLPVMCVETLQSTTDSKKETVPRDSTGDGRHGDVLIGIVPPLTPDSDSGKNVDWGSHEERRTLGFRKKEKETFDVLSIWRMKKGFTKDVSPGMLATRLSSFDSNGSDFDSEANREGRNDCTTRLGIMHPNCMKRATWDIASLCLVLYDMIVLPLQFFNPPETDFDVGMAWLTRFFWTCDIPMSCLTGYVTADGFVELRPNRIIKRYASTWLLLDGFIVSVDWLEILISATEGLGFARFGKASRTFRIIRMLRLLRLARMRELIQIVLERINSEKVVIIADILKLTTLLLAFAHLIACIWFSVGDSDRHDNWVNEFEYKTKNLASQYAISLHWSVAQFAGGMDEITPENLVERLFAIIVFFFGFIAASVFVSSITSSMTQLSIIGSHQSQQLSSLRRYLHQNGISNKLSVRVQRNAKYTVSEQTRSMPESQVALLSHVSEPLRVEIHLEMYAPILMVNQFFSAYIEECPQVMRKVCHYATSIMMVSMGDVVFSAHEIPAHPKMYIIVHGFLAYRHGHSARKEALSVGKDHWLAEACLWTQWMHRGTLTAQSDVRVCTLDANKFQEIVGQFSHAHIKFDPRSYAREFVETLNNEREQTDLPFDYEYKYIKDVEIRGDTSRPLLARAKTAYSTVMQQFFKFRQKKKNRQRVSRLATRGALENR